MHTTGIHLSTLVRVSRVGLVPSFDVHDTRSMLSARAQRKLLFWIMLTIHPPAPARALQTDALVVYCRQIISGITLGFPPTFVKVFLRALPTTVHVLSSLDAFVVCRFKGKESSAKGKSSKTSKSKKAPKKPSFIATIKAFFQSLINPQ